MFVDKVLVQVKAGDGGNGAVSFRHEKFVDRGGPDGGDGGKGGSVIFVGDRTQNTLAQFRYKQELMAQDGMPGSKRQMHGKNGADLMVEVPVGTQVYEGDNLIADIIEEGQQAIIARGGDGGFGNAHFKSSTRQAPRVAEVGEKGEQKELTLELKLLADVGLVGLPNAGKSTFLSVVSNAKPEIGDYPFTTLTPNLGVADIDETSLLIADIPGLIEGASQGKGLGDEFLRHVERTEVLIHLVDIYDDNVAKSYEIINKELANHNQKLAKRPQVVALTKIDGLPEDGIEQKLNQLRKVLPRGTSLYPISSQAHKGVTELLREVAKMVQKARQKASKQATEAGLPVISLNAAQIALAWKVQKQEGYFMITGTKIEKFAARTNFNSEPGIRRIKDIMHKMGIMHELNRQGLQQGDTIAIGRHGAYKFIYEA